MKGPPHGGTFLSLIRLSLFDYELGMKQAGEDKEQKHVR
jgi:hypothetical protein